jgi:hypothetical protein
MTSGSKATFYNRNLPYQIPPMKKLLLLLACLPMISNAQFFREQHACAKAKQRSTTALLQQQAREAQMSVLTSHELKYDVKFVKLDLKLERNTTFISGGVTTVATPTMVMDTFMTILHQNHTIDSIRFNGALVTALRQDSMVKIAMLPPLAAGSTFTVSIYYQGTPPPGGSAIGSAFDTDASGNTWGNEVTWSLSEPVGAYQWWPCKQVLTDKIDSSWVFVTTDSSNKVGSNGRLVNVVPLGNKKRHEWKSRTPINFYLISVAVSDYAEYNFYVKPDYLPNDSILVQNYIYKNLFNSPSWVNTGQKADLDMLPPVMKLYCKTYGMYPFYKEKYGHSMASIGGGEEHQTMTTVGFFDYYVDAHELGHQWWGDNVTCKDWNDIWINEGWATYCELLTCQYLDPLNLQGNINQAHSYVMSLPGGSCFFNNTLDANVIFDYRLTYVKGGSIIRTLQFLTNNDSLWFNTLRGFQNSYKNSNASVIDFKNYYQSQTGIDPTQFFNQWYYGEGYPTFNVKFNHTNSYFTLKSTQTVSMPGVTPIFITPMEYRISRTGKPDTMVRVMHSNPVEIYEFPLSGTITSVRCDPNNWVINKTVGPAYDGTLSTGIPQLTIAPGEMSIGPNPASGIFTLHNPARLNGRAIVWDLAGKLLLEKQLDDETILDLTRYPHGLYEVRVVNEEGGEVYSGKVIRE